MTANLDDVVELWLSDPGYQPERHALISILDHCDTRDRHGWGTVSVEWLREVIASALEVEPPPPQRPEHSDTTVDDVPLRRLVLRVVQPGEQVTVLEAMERLATLGSCWKATSVSNALGYLVRRGQLVREQRGTYSRPGSP